MRYGLGMSASRETPGDIEIPSHGCRGLLPQDKVSVSRNVPHNLNLQHPLHGVVINLLKPNDIYIYMLYRSANLQTLHFKYLFNKYTY